MVNKTYLHVCPCQHAISILQNKSIDNRLRSGPHSLGANRIDAYIGNSCREIRSFVYNIEKLKRDKFFPTLPVNQTQKTIFLGLKSRTWSDVLSLGFGPVIETAKWTIISFELSPKQKVYDREFTFSGKTVYGESFLLEPARIIKPQIISPHEFYGEILGLNQPYRAYQYTPNAYNSLEIMRSEKNIRTRIIK